jgi:Ni2+-binding GTPase involved in maturation of urease and hydrogenase
MIKLFIGGKGSGKTKTLIEMVNNAVNSSNGNVVCIEKGDKLIHDITYKARLIDTDAYSVSDAESLYGFIAGILASNSDITDIFVDSALKICGNDTVAFEDMLGRLKGITNDINLVMTSSITVEDCPEGIKAYI